MCQDLNAGYQGRSRVLPSHTMPVPRPFKTVTEPQTKKPCRCSADAGQLAPAACMRVMVTQ
ncbi:hypothetical protein AVEN_32738-1, partial [Araneus ventricosus]